MPSTFGTLTEFTFTSLDGSTTGDVKQSVAVDLGVAGADGLEVTYRITTASSAGSTNGFFDFFLSKSAESTAALSGGAGDTDAVYNPTGGVTQHKKNLDHVGRLHTNSSVGGSNAVWDGMETITVPIPRYIAAVAESQVGATISSSAADNFVKYKTLFNSS